MALYIIRRCNIKENGNPKIVLDVLKEKAIIHTENLGILK